MGYGDEHGIAVPTLREFFLRSTENPNDPPPEQRVTTQHADFETLWARARSEIERLDLHAQVLDARVKPKRGWDKVTEARNNWIYDECMEGTPYDSINRKLEEKPGIWDLIGSRANRSFPHVLGFPSSERPWVTEQRTWHIYPPPPFPRAISPRATHVLHAHRTDTDDQK